LHGKNPFGWYGRRSPSPMSRDLGSYTRLRIFTMDFKRYIFKNYKTLMRINQIEGF
jgi:hypothetical protein